MTASMRMLIAVAWLLAMPSTAAAADGCRSVIMPKLLGIPQYAAVVRGSDEASREILVAHVDWATPSRALVGKRIHLVNAAPTQSAWIEAIERLNYEKSPGLKILDIRLAGRITHEACRSTSGELNPDAPFKAGRLGAIAPEKEALSMQTALPMRVLTKEHIDRHHF